MEHATFSKPGGITPFDPNLFTSSARLGHIFWNYFLNLPVTSALVRPSSLTSGWKHMAKIREHRAGQGTGMGLPQKSEEQRENVLKPLRGDELWYARCQSNASVTNKINSWDCWTLVPKYYTKFLHWKIKINNTAKRKVQSSILQIGFVNN